MISQEFFSKYLGMSEYQAKYYYDRIKTSHFSSVSGILRLNDDTLLQKFEFYKKELDFSAEKVLDDFRLLTYDTTSDETSPSSVKSKIKYFRDELGFTNRHFAIAVTPFSNDVEYLKQKVAYLNKTLGFEAKQIQSAPSILNLSKETLDEKIAFYKKELGFTSAQFKNTPNLFDFDTTSDAPTSIKSKIKFYQDELGFDASQFRISPSLLTFDTISDSPTSVKTKIKFYKDTFGFQNKHFQQSPVLLGLDCISEDSPTSVKYKAKVLIDTLGFTQRTFQLSPGLLSSSIDPNEPTSTLSKAKFFVNEIGLEPEQLAANPILFHLDCLSGLENPKSIASKIKKLDEIGITIDDIKRDTRLLMTPAEDIKTKYALWSTLFPDKSFITANNWYVTRPEKIYARARFLVEDKKVKELLVAQLNIGEPQFQIRNKVKTEDLMQRYPFTDEVVKSLFDKYKELEIEPPISMD